MRLRSQVIGALNLFRSEPGALSEEDVIVAQALADVATIALLQHRTAVAAELVNEQLTGALNSRIVIEQAKGIIVRATSRRHGTSLLTTAHPRPQHQPTPRDVAGDVVDGTLDLRGLPPSGA